MATPQTSPRTFHPLAWKFFIAGLVVLTVGVIRVNLFGPGVPVQQVIAPATQSREPGPMRIVVTLPPLMWAVKALAPPDAQITLLSPPGAGCEGIELTPSHVAAIRKADIIVRAGTGIDNDQNLVNARGQRDIVLAELGAPADPHVWLDPVAMEKQCDELAVVIPEVFEEICEPTEWNSTKSRDCVAATLLVKTDCVKNQTDLSHRCREIDAEYTLRLAPFKGRPIITHHDAWSTVARRYGLEIAAVIQHTHDAEPSPADLADVARIMKEKGIKAIFIEPQLNPAAANRISEITGAKVLTLDPLGDGDWPAMMRKNLDALVEGLSAN